jgi:hypothetical protein
MFVNVNHAQYVWYQEQMNIDEEEKFELLRDVAEHNAMFWNSEGVQQVKEARKNTYKTSDEDFNKMVTEMFGRELSSETVDPIEILEQNRKKQSDLYLDMELDEINFIPDGE